MEARQFAASPRSRVHSIWPLSSWKSIRLSDLSCSELHQKCTGFSPLHICFTFLYFLQWSPDPSCFSRLTSLVCPKDQSPGGSGRCCHRPLRGTWWWHIHASTVTLPSLKTGGRPISTPCTTWVIRAILCWRRSPGCPSASLCAAVVGLPDLATKITTCPVQVEFQINDKCF